MLDYRDSLVMDTKPEAKDNNHTAITLVLSILQNITLTNLQHLTFPNQVTHNHADE